MFSKAFLYDTLLLLYNRPVQFLIIRLTTLFGKTFYIPGNGYFVNDLELSKKILKDEEYFSSHHTGSIGEMASLVAGEIPLLFNMEGTDHRNLRYKLMAVFNQKYIEEVSEKVLKPYMKEQVEILKNGGEIDVVEIIRIITSKMTGFILGVDYDAEKDKELMLEFTDITERLTHFLSLGKVKPSEKELEAAKKLYDRLNELLAKHYKSVEKTEKSVMGKMKEQEIPEEIAIGLLVILMIAGTETVSSGLPRGIALLHDSGDWKKLINDQNLIENTISEIFRFVSPSPLILHSVKKDINLDGIKFRKDNRLLICQYNILHKSKYNKNANKFDISREQSKDTKYFWFGHGPHFCIGAALAMEELKVILTELSTPKKNIKVVKRSFKFNVAFPSYKSLVIKYV